MNKRDHWTRQIVVRNNQNTAKEVRKIVVEKQRGKRGLHQKTLKNEQKQGK